MISVRFTYLTGLKRRIFRNARLAGQLERLGRVADDGDHRRGRLPRLHGHGRLPRRPERARKRTGACGSTAPGGRTRGAQPRGSRRRVAAALPARSPSRRRGLGRGAVLLHVRRHLGAQKTYAGGSAAPDLRFSVWAPNAGKVEVVFGQGRQRLHRGRRGGHRPRTSGHRPRRRGRSASGRASAVGDFSRVRRPPVHVPDQERPGRRPSTAPTSTRAGRSGAGDMNPAKASLGRRPGRRSTGPSAAAWSSTRTSCGAEFEPTAHRAPPDLIARRRVLGHASSRRACRSRPASKISSSTSCTSARSGFGKTTARRL